MVDGSGRARGTKATSGDAAVEAMLAVSRAVASGGPPGRVLDEIATQTTFLMNAQGASILELAGDRLRIVGSHRLSSDYRRRLDAWPMPLATGRGPAGLAVSRRAPILTADATSDPRFTDYAELIRDEGYRALAAAPLLVGETVLGTITVYRTTVYDWPDEEVRLLTFFAEHAATAVHTAHLIAEQQREVEALQRLVRRLREQTHEHANRLHAIIGLLASGDTDEALAFLEGITHAHLADRRILEGQPSNNALAGLLAVEMILARQRSIDVQLDIRENLDRLPLTQAQALTIVGNLLDNAFDAVADMAQLRRRVRLTISKRESLICICVRDWGMGFENVDEAFALGYSTKTEHSGMGLALVRDAVQAARGRISVQPHADGTAFVITLPTQGDA
jgi:two-component system CitB family sensor kinase